MTRFWMSWEEPIDEADDSRPDGQWPLPESIKAWWRSGLGEGYHTLCAVVDAVSQTQAEEEVAKSWPGHGVWRFCEEKAADFRPGDRFPWPKQESSA